MDTMKVDVGITVTKKNIKKRDELYKSSSYFFPYFTENDSYDIISLQTGIWCSKKKFAYIKMSKRWHFIGGT